MAQIIIKKNDGTEIVVKNNVPESIIASDVLYSGDYIGQKLWCKEDVIQQAYEDDLFPSKSLIEGACRYLNDSGRLSDATDSDWATISYALYRNKGLPESIEGFALPGEYIVRLVLEGDYCERCIISETEEITDLGGCIEFTLNRILDIGLNEYILSEEQVDELICSIMGASKSEKNPIWIDKGYTLPNILSYKVIANE